MGVGRSGQAGAPIKSNTASQAERALTMPHRTLSPSAKSAALARVRFPASSPNEDASAEREPEEPQRRASSEGDAASGRLFRGWRRARSRCFRAPACCRDRGPRSLAPARRATARRQRSAARARGRALRSAAARCTAAPCVVGGVIVVVDFRHSRVVAACRRASVEALADGSAITRSDSAVDAAIGARYRARVSLGVAKDAERPVALAIGDSVASAGVTACGDAHPAFRANVAAAHEAGGVAIDIDFAVGSARDARPRSGDHGEATKHGQETSVRMVLAHGRYVNTSPRLATPSARRLAGAARGYFRIAPRLKVDRKSSCCQHPPLRFAARARSCGCPARDSG
jgi:hypothetical protein